MTGTRSASCCGEAPLGYYPGSIAERRRKAREHEKREQELQRALRFSYAQSQALVEFVESLRLPLGRDAGLRAKLTALTRRFDAGDDFADILPT